MDVLSGALWAIGTVVVLVVGLGIAGFAVLFRRRGDAGLARGSSGGLAALTRRAGSQLVALDDRVRDAGDEIGYAAAQFGDQRAAPFVDALHEARAKLAEAFRLRQALDDATPDSPREQREWTLQIIALTDQATALLDEQNAAFRALRGSEADAGRTVDALRDRLGTTTARLASAVTTLAELTTVYAREPLAGVHELPDRIRESLTTAEREIAEAASRVTASGVNAVTDRITAATNSLRDADRMLDTMERTATDLASASATLATRRAELDRDLADARKAADTAPDPDTGAAILAAIAEVEAVAPLSPAHPVAELDRLEDALRSLDLALAGARNQADRLAHARAAYEGTLVSARSQIGVARDLIARGGVGVEARTRLAEAERQLTLAEAAAATDPVEALDAIRRAVTHARDADDLARYDTMGRR